jgi:hypothetical protein
MDKKRAKMRLVDTLGEEKEFHDAHVAYYLFLPQSFRSEISSVLGAPIYSVAREKHGDVLGGRVFAQTGEKDGDYLLTFEVMDKDAAKAVCAILERKLTQRLRQEILQDCEATRERLGI